MQFALAFLFFACFVLGYKVFLLLRKRKVLTVLGHVVSYFIEIFASDGPLDFVVKCDYLLAAMFSPYSEKVFLVRRVPSTILPKVPQLLVYRVHLGPDLPTLTLLFRFKQSL